MSGPIQEKLPRLAGGGINTEHRAHDLLGLAWIWRVQQVVGFWQLFTAACLQDVRCLLAGKACNNQNTGVNLKKSHTTPRDTQFLDFPWDKRTLPAQLCGQGLLHVSQLLVELLAGLLDVPLRLAQRLLSLLWGTAAHGRVVRHS